MAKITEEREEKVEHNKEVYEKMTSIGMGRFGDGFIDHHVDRCNRG